MMRCAQRAKLSPVSQTRIGRDGFTLIELLVVIAIIAILASDSVPRVQSKPVPKPAKPLASPTCASAV